MSKLSITHLELKQLLVDPACPYAIYWERFREERWDELKGGAARRRTATKPIEVEALKEFVRSRRGDDPLLESKLDQIIAELGGKRLSMIDPWSLPRRVLRRLQGKENPSTDVYELPETFFREARRE